MTTPDPRTPAPNEVDPEAPALLSSDLRPHGASASPLKPLSLRHYVWIIGAAIVVIACLEWLGPVLTPFLVSTILAYLGTPIVDRAKARGVPRTLATIAVVLLFGLILAGLFFVLVPLIQAEFSLASRRIPDLLALLSENVVPWLDEHFGIRPSFDMQAIRDFLAQNADTAQEFSLRVLDRAFSIGILTGLLVFIPYVGFGLGLVLGVVAAALQWHGLAGFVAVLAVYCVGQLLANYVLIPWLIGDRIGLHPLAVIFALLAFGQLFGFAGILLALPVSAALLVGLRHLRRAYVVSPIYNRD